MKITLLLVSTLWIICPANSKLHRIVAHVNNANASWQAGINNFHTNDHKKLVGTIEHPYADDHVFGDSAGKAYDCGNYPENNDSNDIPESFDARYHWFQCSSISHIWNQGNCAADWVCPIKKHLMKGTNPVIRPRLPSFNPSLDPVKIVK